MNVEVKLGEYRFANPLILASGTFGYGLKFPEAADAMGALITKGISVNPRIGNPPPRIWDSAETVINSVGLENVGLDNFKRQIIPSLRITCPVYVNLAGVTADDFRILVQALDTEERISGFELNLSCPNVKEGGVALGQSPEKVQEVTSLCRALTQKPIWVKLTSNFCDVRQTAKAAQAGGADAVVIVNTLNALVVDTANRRPFLGAGSGGLSGPALRPHVLYLVAAVSRILDIPVIASGGVTTGRDVVEYLLAGARLVQIGSANLVDPLAGLRILDQLKTWFRDQNIESPDEIIGKLEDR